MERTPAPLESWLIEPLSADVVASLDRLRRSDDVRHVAVMPDVHLAREVCVGAVVATDRLIYPAAVGGDIGCGMAAVRVAAEGGILRDERAAARVLAGLYEAVPANKHRSPRTFPKSLLNQQLSNDRLARLAGRDGRVQFGTLGRGNHFLEFQVDQEDCLWAIVHSGSRAMGQAISQPWLQNHEHRHSALQRLEASSAEGQAYLADSTWARAYATENRLAMLSAVDDLVARLFGAQLDWNSLIHGDHNHVQQEEHLGEIRWVHRKGAQPAAEGEPGIVPGSMGTATFHVSGRGCEASLQSCSHGAGRQLSRGAARATISARQLSRQMNGVWYDYRRTEPLRDEAPAAYKDVRAVMRAQRPLVRIVRELRPLLVYKGC